MKDLILLEKKASDMVTARIARNKNKKIEAKKHAGIVPELARSKKKNKKDIPAPLLAGACKVPTFKNGLILNDDIKTDAPLFIVVIKGNKKLSAAQSGGGGGKFDMPCESVFKNDSDMTACRDSKQRKIHKKSVKSFYSKAGLKTESLKSLSIRLNLSSDDIKKELFKCAKYHGVKNIKKALYELPLDNLFMG
jgi:hypothetical protein